MIHFYKLKMSDFVLPFIDNYITALILSQDLKFFICFIIICIFFICKLIYAAYLSKSIYN